MDVGQRAGIFLLLLGATAASSGTCCEVRAQEAMTREVVQAYARPFTAADASAQAYRRGEQRRRADVAQQVGVTQYIRWLNGLPPTLSREVRVPADRAAYYAYGATRDRGWCFGVFEPWPYLPGDIWGFSFDRPVPQSVGQRQIQTGPNRWESHPIYRRSESHPPRPTGPRSY